MYYSQTLAHVQARALKILVIDDDDTTTNTVAAALPPGCCEVILCRDLALAEVATDLTEFDLILVAPTTTGLDGPEGLAVADFLAARNPFAKTTLLLPDEDQDLRAVVEQRGLFSVLAKPVVPREVLSLVSALGPGATSELTA